MRHRAMLGVASAVAVLAVAVADAWGQAPQTGASGGQTGGGQTGGGQLSGGSGMFQGPELGTTSQSTGGLGAQRINRAGGGLQNPLSARGLESLGAVGAQQQGSSRTSQPGLRGSSFLSSQFGRFGLRSSRLGGRSQNRNRAQYSLRPVFRPSASTAAASAKLATGTLAAIERSVRFLDGASGVQVAFEAGSVVLRGTVASEHDRRIAELMAKLEPGVRRVRNELQVVRGPQGKAGGSERLRTSTPIRQQKK